MKRSESSKKPVKKSSTGTGPDAEEGVRESEEKYRTVLDHLPDLAFVHRDGITLYINPAMIAALGLKPGEGLNRQVLDYIAPEYHPLVADAIRKRTETGWDQPYEIEILPPRGERRAVLIRGSVIEFDGSPAILNVLTDITERKRAEETLRESEEKYRVLAENATDIIWVLDLATLKFTYFSPSVEKIRGYTPEEAMRLSLDQTFTPKAYAKSQTDLKEVLEQEKKGLVEPGRIRVYEYQERCKDGSTIYTESMMKFIRDADGKTIKIQGITRDVTRRKRAEEALRESRQLFSNIISFLPDPTFVIDKDGNVLAWNRALEQLSGTPAGDIIGKGDHEYSLRLYGKRRPILIDLVLHPDEDAAKLNYTDIISDGHTVTAQTELTMTGSGHRMSLSLVASPLIDPQEGKITGAIESMRDITELKETEAELNRINQNLDALVQDRTKKLEEEVAQRRKAEDAVEELLQYTRGVIEANPDLMVVLDGAGTILDVNAAAELLTGLPRKQLIGTSFLNFNFLVVDGGLPDTFSWLLETGRLAISVQVRRADGYITPLSINAIVIAGSPGTTGTRIIVSGHDISRQIQDEQAIRTSLEEKVVLLREVHHRVKNNLQIIISLVNLQMRQTEDPGLKLIMAETQNRVRAMSLVHEKLYRSESLSKIDFADYTRFLATQLFSFYGTDTRRVRLDLTMGKIMVDINTAVPLGLLMNELVSNALKHAFPQEREGTINISGGDAGDLITLVVRDNGIGIPEELDWKNTTSLGMRLITSLIDQVDGTVTLDRKNGTAFTITIKRDPASGDAE